MIDQEGFIYLFDVFILDVIFDVVDSVGFVIDGCLMGFNSFENWVYQVGLEDIMLVVVKFYWLQCWSDVQIFEEYVFSCFLCEQELLVVVLLVNDWGEILFYYVGFCFIVFLCQGGYVLEFDNVDYLLVLGCILVCWYVVGNDCFFQICLVIDIIVDCCVVVDYVNQGVVDFNFLGCYWDLGGVLIEVME